MNITIIEKEILKAIDIERQGVQKENAFMTLETIEDRFIDLENFVKKLFTEYKEG
tara:strand:+ start:415 stop:579 length:165 start_codon:yes stop_codon:yes gene_type:complete